MVYTIEKKPYGIRLCFNGMMDEETAKNFVNDFNKVLDTIAGSISIMIDLINGSPMPGKSQILVNELYQKVIQKGLIRSANIVPSSMMKLQMVRLAKEHGTYDKARYINFSDNPGWEKIALDWLENGIDPDK